MKFVTLINKSQKGRVQTCIDQKQFLLFFSTALFIADWSKETEWSKRGRKKNCTWLAKGKIIPQECSVMLNYQLEIVRDKFVSFIDHCDKFYVNLLFDRSIYRPRCTHTGYPYLCTYI